MLKEDLQMNNKIKRNRIMLFLALFAMFASIIPINVFAEDEIKKIN